MILTVTLNPALDLTYQVFRLEPHASHRVHIVYERAGGKGVNVARVLHTLGHDPVVTGLAGGSTGATIRAHLAHLSLTELFVRTNSSSRRTVTVVEPAGATVFNEPGPEVSAAEWADFRAGYRDLVSRAAVVVLAGSLPPGVPTDAYAELTRLAGDAVTIVDTSGDALVAALAARPDVVKPNADELAATTGCSSPRQAAAALREAGAGAVVASLGPEGLLAITEHGAWRAEPSEPLDGNPTGAGDACVAALAAGLAGDADWPTVLADAVALSAAAVVAPVAGEVDLPTYRRARPRVVLEDLSASEAAAPAGPRSSAGARNERRAAGASEASDKYSHRRPSGSDPGAQHAHTDR